MHARYRYFGNQWRKVGAVMMSAGLVGVWAGGVWAQDSLLGQAREAARVAEPAPVDAEVTDAAEADDAADAPADNETPTEQAEAADDIPANEAADAPANEIDDETLLEDFRVVPSQFNVNSYLHFDDEGNVRNEQHNMSMGLNIFYGHEFTPRAYRNFQIDRFVTAAGEELEVQHRMNGEQVIHHHNHHGNQAPRFGVNFQLTRPKRAAEVVRRLEGSVEVILPMGEPQHAVLKPVKDILGKQVHIANFPGSELQITRDNHDRMRIQMNAELASLMDQVRFYDANNREINAQPRGSGRSGTQHHLYYQFDVPEDGQIMFTFLSETRVLRVPFKLENIPLPQPGGGGGVDLVIRAEAGEPIVRHVGPGESDLEVSIE